jgi:hypothetical protein
MLLETRVHRLPSKIGPEPMSLSLPRHGYREMLHNPHSISYHLIPHYTSLHLTAALHIPISHLHNSYDSLFMLEIQL